MALESSKLYGAVKSGDIGDVRSLLETTDDAKLRNEAGETILHIAVANNVSAEIIEALLTRVDFSLRNTNGQTAVDVGNGATELVKNRIEKLLLPKIEVTEIEELIINGWDFWPDLVDLRHKSIETADYLENILEWQQKSNELQTAIVNGPDENIKDFITDKYTKIENRTGLLPLQIAVIFEKEEVVDNMVKEVPITLKHQDNFGRTALHYASASRSEMYEKLKDLGADENIKDMLGKTPKDYKEDDKGKLMIIDLQKQMKDIMDRPQKVWSRPTSSKSTASNREKQADNELKPKIREKVTMYIPNDAKNRPDVKEPNGMDSRYLAEIIGQPLGVALAEIAEKRPSDPIEYLAQWLYKYRITVDHIQSKEKEFEQIQQEEREAELEEENRVKRLEEQRKIEDEEKKERERIEEEERRRKEQEDLQRKAKEAASLKTPNLPTVSEENEEDVSTVRERDEKGQTELHRLAAQSGADLVTVMNQGFSPADRDGNNKTARDIAEDNKIQDNVEAIDNYISNLIEHESYDSLNQLLYDSYDKLSTVIEQVSTDGLPDDVNKFIKSIPDTQENIRELLKSAESGILSDTQQNMLKQNKKLAFCKDMYGRSPLHIAALHGKHDVLEFLISYIPHTVKCRDNLNRTPLHYAMATSESLTALLTEQNADEQAKDVKDRVPSYYQDNKSEIVDMLND